MFGARWALDLEGDHFIRSINVNHCAVHLQHTIVMSPVIEKLKTIIKANYLNFSHYKSLYFRKFVEENNILSK